MESLSADLSVRALTWEIASHLLSFPDMNLVRAIRQAEISTALRETVMHIHPDIQATEALAARLDYLGTMEDEALLHLLRQEYTRIFIGPPTPLISLSEGAWRQRAEGNEHPLMLVNEITCDVQRLFKTCGVRLCDDCRDAIDNADNECAFAWIALTHASEDPVWLQTYELFLTSHIAQWLPGFCRDLTTSESCTLYDELGTFLGAFADTEIQRAISTRPEAE